MTYASRNLQGELEDISLRMDFDGGALLCRDVASPGKWILISAMRRMEAGQLHGLGGRPGELRISDHPWKICVASVGEETAIEIQQSSFAGEMPEQAEADLRAAISYRYPHSEATKAPSKQTATDRKGRQKDTEVSEYTDAPVAFHRRWRLPSFVAMEKDPKAVGNAIHGAMQYIRYENCTDPEGVHNEILRLCQEGLLSK